MMIQLTLKNRKIDNRKRTNKNTMHYKLSSYEMCLNRMLRMHTQDGLNIFLLSAKWIWPYYLSSQTKRINLASDACRRIFVQQNQPAMFVRLLDHFALICCYLSQDGVFRGFFRSFRFGPIFACRQ